MSILLGIWCALFMVSLVGFVVSIAAPGDTSEDWYRAQQ